MKCRIPLTPHNVNILIEEFGADPEKLTTDYWVQYIMTNEKLITRLIERPHPTSSPDVGRRITYRAGRLRKKYIREITGLPTPRGNKTCIRAYRNFYKQYKIELRT